MHGEPYGNLLQTGKKQPFLQSSQTSSIFRSESEVNITEPYQGMLTLSKADAARSRNTASVLDSRISRQYMSGISTIKSSLTKADLLRMAAKKRENDLAEWYGQVADEHASKSCIKNRPR